MSMYMYDPLTLAHVILRREKDQHLDVEVEVEGGRSRGGGGGREV